MYKGDQSLLLFLSEFLFFFAWFPLSPSLVSPHYPLLPIHVNKCPFTFSSNLTWSYSNIYMQKPTYLYACILYKAIILYMLFTQQLQVLVPPSQFPWLGSILSNGYRPFPHIKII